MSGDEKLAVVSKYGPLLVEMGKRDPDIRALAVKIVSSCQEMLTNVKPRKFTNGSGLTFAMLRILLR